MRVSSHAAWPNNIGGCAMKTAPATVAATPATPTAVTASVPMTHAIDGAQRRVGVQQRHLRTAAARLQLMHARGAAVQRADTLPLAPMAVRAA